MLTSPGPGFARSAGSVRKPQRSAAAQPAASLPEALSQQVAISRRGIPSLAVAVAEVATGQEVFGYQADQPRILASNTKLLTTAAAVDLLGDGFEFRTPLLASGTISDGVLAGDLAVVGSGDPNISGRLYDGDSYAVFRTWAQALRARGISRVTGDLYLVNGLFEPTHIHPDWPRDQLGRWYEAPVDALSFSDNCILVRVSPGNGPGLPGRIELVPDLKIYRVVSNVVTTESRRRHSLIVYREPESREIRVSGEVWARSGPFEAWVTVPEPVDYFGAALRAALEEEGITIAGRSAVAEKLPEGSWETLAEHRSDLATTLSVTNHRSQNFYAESLLKVLGARTHGEGSWPAGVQAVREFLARQGVGDGVQLADGSGMSRNNRATPREMTQLLRAMYLHPAGATFVRSLPSSGCAEPGWRYRLAQPPYRGNVLAKTGTLSDVSTLSGYAKARSGKLYAFSILANNTAVWRARTVQDAILRQLIDHG